MQKIDERFTKIYIFDLNPGNDDITKEFIMGKLSRIMKNISLYQYFVIVSHSSLKVLKKIVNDAKISLGYIVSDSGARIYNISTKKVIFEKHIERNDVLGISHCLTMSDLLQLISISNNEFIYSFDPMNEYIFSKMHYINSNNVSTYGKFKELLEKNSVFSFLCFQRNSLDFSQKFANFNNVSSDWNVNVSRLGDSSFVVYHKDASKYKAILKIMESKKISNFQNVYYYGINSVDVDCYNSFKNHLISVSAYYETKNFGNTIYTVSYDAILNELSISLKNSVKSSNRKKNVFMNPNALINNSDEKTFNLKDLYQSEEK